MEIPNMQDFLTTVKAAHEAATLAMTTALAEYRATLDKPGNEERKANAIRGCGSWANVEPMYCGFAWVIVPRVDNPEFIKTMKAAQSSGNRRDVGDAAGYQTKGTNTATDWLFHGPGSYHGQSMDIKEVGAAAFAKYLSDNGVKNVKTRSRAD